MYSSTVYDSLYDPSSQQTEVITATFVITDSVQWTEKQGDYFVAEVKRKVLFVEGNRLVEFRGGRRSGSTWYIADGVLVYRTDEKPIPGQKPDQLWLEYMFPLSENHCWFPSSEDRNQFAPGLCNRFVNGPFARETSAGKFDDCYEVMTVYTSGGTLSWFCNSVGSVFALYDHNGTPFGYNEMLIGYQIKQP